jgi:hypothetical protein
MIAGANVQATSIIWPSSMNRLIYLLSARDPDIYGGTL